MRVSCVKLCVQVLCITEVTLQNYTLISYQTKVVCISYVIVDIKKHAKEMAGRRGGKPELEA